ncbi:MAG: MBL fold metallo-hydrolase, partial [Flavobacteriales bacterium]|nr:MBL fold metallo-hydrolase [Flavobacteriales bacterium]
MKKILKMIGIVILSVILIIVVSVVLFINFSPQFGGSASDKKKDEYSKSSNYLDGKFQNIGGITIDNSFGVYVKMLKEYLKPQPNSIPQENVSVSKMDSLDIAEYQGETRLFWFGHSTFLLEIEDKNILIDPMMGEVPAPHPWLGAKRFSNQLPIKIEKLPQIDAVILSHDHYDHLDYGSIQILKDKVEMFYTPLGVGAHLQAWGIEKERIV